MKKQAMNRTQTYRWLGMMLTGLLFLGMACLMVACSDDSGQDMEDGDTLQLLTYSRTLSRQESLATRAAMEGCVRYTTGPITAYMTPDGAERATNFRYSTTTNRWSSAYKIQEGHDYYIYGFSPSDAVSGSSVSAPDGGYQNGATLKLNGLKPVLDKDFCLIVGVKQVDTVDDPEPETIPLGSFFYKGMLKNQNFAYMLLHHFYAALSFTMKVDVTYNQLRTIKLKKMELKDLPVSYTTVWIQVSSNSTDSYPANNVTWLQSTEKATLQFFKHDGLELNVDAQPLTLKMDTEDLEKIMVSPALSNSLTLVCTYDVYDKQGNLVRQDCTAENKLQSVALTRGEWRTVNLTVNPTYLYVLSEPDLDNPTVVIGN